MARNPLIVNGSGAYGGGLYGNVKVNGEAEIVDALDCLNLSIRGTSKVSGNTTAKTISVFGEGIFAGSVEAEKLKVSGSCRIERDAEIKTSLVRGEMEIGGRFSTEKAEIKGSLDVKEDVEAEAFIFKGKFLVGGLLNAEEIEIALKYSNSRAGEIGGKKIDVRMQGGLPGMFGKKRHLLHADIIEGDQIYLEYTEAGTVRGENIEIGPGCKIGLVEYTGTLNISNEAVVEKQQKTGAHS